MQATLVQLDMVCFYCPEACLVRRVDTICVRSRESSSLRYKIYDFPGFAGERCEGGINKCTSDPRVYVTYIDCVNGYQCFCPGAWQEGSVWSTPVSVSPSIALIGTFAPWVRRLIRTAVFVSIVLLAITVGQRRLDMTASILLSMLMR